MGRPERLAWFNLSVVVLALASWAGLLVGTGFRWQAALGASAVLGLLGLGGVRRLWYPREGGVHFDERDAEIHRRSVVLAYALFWVGFVAASLGLWYRHADRGVVPAFALPYLVVAGFCAVTLVQSLAIIIQYRRGER